MDFDILVVDDDLNIRTLLEKVLKVEGHTNVRELRNTLERIVLL